jgi:hypothetical protein
MTTAHWALRQDVSFQREDTSIIFSSIHWQARAIQKSSSRGTGRGVARASADAGARIPWLGIGLQGSEGQWKDTKERIETLNWRSARNSHRQR